MKSPLLDQSDAQEKQSTFPAYAFTVRDTIDSYGVISVRRADVIILDFEIVLDCDRRIENRPKSDLPVHVTLQNDCERLSGSTGRPLIISGYFSKKRFKASFRRTQHLGIDQDLNHRS